MPNIEYEKGDEGTLKIIVTPDVVPTVQSISLDELLKKEEQLTAELTSIQEKIKKCRDLGIRSKREIILEEDANKRAANDAKLAQ